MGSGKWALAKYAREKGKSIFDVIKEINKKKEEADTECPYTDSPTPTGNGRCEWCGEDHWRGDD